MAFKEWRVVVDALGRGGQIVILRKGGISEGRDGFRVEHENFWLFPTEFHQQREGVVESAKMGFDHISWPSEGLVRIEFRAEVVAARRLAALEIAERLRGQHIWRDEVIAERFDWGRDEGIYAMALRVSRLLEPVELSLVDAYGGCKSWVELGCDLPQTTEPVLGEAAFADKLALFREAVEGEVAG